MIDAEFVQHLLGLESGCEYPPEDLAKFVV